MVSCTMFCCAAKCWHRLRSRREGRQGSMATETEVISQARRLWLVRHVFWSFFSLCSKNRFVPRKGSRKLWTIGNEWHSWFILFEASEALIIWKPMKYVYNLSSSCTLNFKHFPRICDKIEECLFISKHEQACMPQTLGLLGLQESWKYGPEISNIN